MYVSAGDYDYLFDSPTNIKIKNISIHTVKRNYTRRRFELK